jgi:hypothetical protein
MKSEIFVVNSVRTSERAFSAVAEHIPSTDVSALLKVLQSSRRLRQAAVAMRVDYDKVFVHLAKAIDAAFNRQPVVHFSRDHMRMLLNADVQSLLKDVLACDPRDTLQTLFSVPHLQDTLDYVTEGRLSGLPTSAAYLINELLRSDRAQKLEFDHTTTSSNWERIVVDEEWLAPESGKRLLASSKARSVSTPVRALAEFLERSRQSEEEAVKIDLPGHQSIGPLGLLELRRRLSWIVEQLQTHALEDAENAAGAMLASPSMQILRPLLYLYEFGYVKQGLKAYMDYTRPLESLLPKQGLEVYSVDESKVIPTSNLSFAGEEPYIVAGQRVGTFSIKCKLSGQNELQTILRSTEVSGWAYDQLQQDIPRLRPNDLSPEGTGLADRLLKTSFPILEPEVRLLRQAVDQLGDRLTQAIALSCEKPILQIPDLWRGRVADRLPYMDLPARADPLYSEGVEDIIVRHQRTYDQVNRAIKVVRGITAGGPDMPDQANSVEESADGIAR